MSAVIVFIDRLNQAPFDRRSRDYTRCCGLAVEAFEGMRPLGGTGISCQSGSLISGKIVSVIRNCLDEWKKRRDAKQRTYSVSITKKPSDLDRPALESDSDDSDFEYPRARELKDSRLRSRAPFELPVSSAPVTQNGFGLRRGVGGDEPVVGQILQYHPPEIMNQAFVNTQFLPDVSFVNGVPFNHGNAFTIMPGSPYEPLTALLNSDIAQASSQFKVTSSGRAENVIQSGPTSNSRQDDEEPVSVYNYNPNERIEKMFGINPMWK